MQKRIPSRLSGTTLPQRRCRPGAMLTAGMVVIAAGLAYALVRHLDRPVSVSAGGEYANRRVGYALALPDGWTAGDELPGGAAQSLADQVAQASAKYTTEQSKVFVATQPSVASDPSVQNCISGPYGDAAVCLPANASTGAYATVSLLTTADRRSLDEEILAQRNDLGVQWTELPISAGGRRTFSWHRLSVPPEIEGGVERSALYFISYLFERQPGVLYEVSGLVYQGRADRSRSARDLRFLVDRYAREIDSLVSSFQELPR